jgi:predicted Zn-ribbon and HTH transcriptional regulator
MGNDIGDKNLNRQELLAKTAHAGTDHNARIWAAQCSDCGHVYGVNGSDFHDRKCPKCQGGKPGI